MSKWVPYRPQYKTGKLDVPQRVWTHYHANLNQVKMSSRTSKVRGMAFKDAWMRFIRESQK